MVGVPGKSASCRARAAGGDGRYGSQLGIREVVSDAWSQYSGHESPGGAKRAAYAFLSGVGAPRLEVESIVAYESQESAEK